MPEAGIINVYSEIGNLKKVLLHKPSSELENITPSLLKSLLFDDIPFLKVAKEEHKAFVNVLEGKGCSVVFIEDLLRETLESSSSLKTNFISEFVKESNIKERVKADILSSYLESLNSKVLVEKLIGGVAKREIPSYERAFAKSCYNDENFFLSLPMPNTLFTRDPLSSIGRGITINKMWSETRKRESLFIDYIFNYHPQYRDSKIPKYYNRSYKYSLEGGDIIVLSKDVLAIGISQRTEKRALELLAKEIFSEEDSFKVILGIEIPKKRSYMHLDTIFTNVADGVFTVYQEEEIKFSLFALSKNEKGEIKTKREKAKLEDFLKFYLSKEKITLINCGGGDPIASRREQWNDGANTLAIAPGEVIVYERNYVTNKILKEHGIKTYEIPSSELSRGRGGPRCMSMPLIREDF